MISPLGEPIPDLELYVLDAALNPVPVGVPGELHIAGPGVARGYHNRAELTAQRFVAHPRNPEVRLYKTGDLVRFLPDGEIEYLRRIDEQIKIRGYRIELGEIQNALTSHEHIDHAVVTVHEPAPGDKRLVGYFTTPPGASVPDVNDLRTHLGATLPPYMIPGQFLHLPEIPLTTSGKLDRRRLPAPSGERPDLGTSYTAPTIPAEQTLTDIWAAVLQLDTIGIHDNFFDLGGDSMSALRITARCREAGLNLNPRLLLEELTVARVAARLTTAPDRADGTLLPLRAEGSLNPLFCVHPGGGSAFGYRPLLDALDPDLPIYAFQALDVADGEAPRTIEDIAAGYLTEMRAVQPHGPYTLIGWSLGATIAFEMARRLTEAGEEVADVFLLEPALCIGILRPQWRRLLQALDDLRGGLDAVSESKGPVDALAHRLVSLIVESGLIEPGNLPADLPPAEQWTHLRRVAPELPVETWHRLMSALVAYDPSPYPGPTHLVVTQDLLRGGDGSEEAAFLAREYVPYWRSFVGGDCPVQPVSQAHTAMLSGDSLAVIAGLVNTSVRGKAG